MGALTTRGNHTRVQILCQPFVVRCGRYYNRRGSRDGQIRRVCPSSLQRVLLHIQNCRTYSTPEEFADCIREVLHSEPVPIPPEESRRLTWHDATERFLDAAEPVPTPFRRRFAEAISDGFLAGMHNMLTASEAMRCLVGGGAGTLLNPDGLAEWRPDEWSGGVMDRK